VTESITPTSPQLSGTALTVTANASGCPHPLYEFWVLLPGSTTWQLLYAYSSISTLNWNTADSPAGTYRYTVWARDASSIGTAANSLGTFDTYFPATGYTMTSQPCASVTESATQSGATVTFSASASGCPSPLYQFWVLVPGSTTWQMVQPYSANATFSWNTTGLAPGTYRYTVWVRDSSSLGTSSNSLGTFDAYFPAAFYTLP
jgi:hypothetical protein